MPGRRTRPAPASSPSPSSVRHGGGGSGRIGQNLRRRIYIKQMQRSWLLFGGQNLLNSLPNLLFKCFARGGDEKKEELHQGDVKKT